MASAKVKTRGGTIKQLVTRRKPIQKRALIEAGEFWHENMLPNHFDASAHFRYRGPDTYRPRSKKYNKRKRALFGHSIPLVFSGDLKRVVLQEQRVSGTSKRATVNLKGTRYLFPFKKNTRDHDKAAELTALHPQEGIKLGKVVRASRERQFNAIKGTKTERIA